MLDMTKDLSRLYNFRGTTKPEKISKFLIDRALPAGWVVLLTGMFWLQSYWQYHRFFDWLIVLPCLFIFCFRAKLALSLMRSRIFVCFLFFSCYMLITIVWAENLENIFKPVSRCLFIGIFMLSAGLLVMEDDDAKIMKILQVSAFIATLSAVFSLCYFMYEFYRSGYFERLQGYGVLSNALLTTHVYGVFVCYFLVRLIVRTYTDNRLLSLCHLSILVILLIFTGSRTPFMALAFALIWLLLATNSNLRTILTVLFGVAVFMVVLFLIQNSLTKYTFVARGFSYRPEIWHLTLQMIAEKPWFGHGYTSSTIIVGSSLPSPMPHPHNILLLVAYKGGLVGLILWIAIYVNSFYFAWQHRQNNLILIASTWLVYGLGAGLTDSPPIMPRPAEIWFLIWIPLALLFAAGFAEKQRRLKELLDDGAK
jgi:O-antigen ligase